MLRSKSTAGLTKSRGC
jgi:serine/threonine kinase 16